MHRVAALPRHGEIARQLHARLRGYEIAKATGWMSAAVHDAHDALDAVVELLCKADGNLSSLVQVHGEMPSPVVVIPRYPAGLPLRHVFAESRRC